MGFYRKAFPTAVKNLPFQNMNKNWVCLLNKCDGCFIHLSLNYKEASSMLVPCFSVVTLTGAQMVFATISHHKRNVQLALLTLFPLWTPLLVLTTTTTIINLMQCGKHRAKLMRFSAKCCAFHHPSHPALQVCGAQWVGPSEVSRNKWVESRFLWADHHWKHIIYQCPLRCMWKIISLHCCQVLTHIE